MFNIPKMIIRSTKLDLTAEPFLLVLLKRVLCSSIFYHHFFSLCYLKNNFNFSEGNF